MWTALHLSAWLALDLAGKMTLLPEVTLTFWGGGLLLMGGKSKTIAMVMNPREP